MSERGLILALQRLHDDPGFADMVRQDSQGTLGLYDLDDTECNALITAVQRGDNNTLRQMAQQVGIDWTSDYISGLGSLDESEVSIEDKPPIGIQGPGAFPGDGYEGVQGTRPSGT